MFEWANLVYLVACMIGWCVLFINNRRRMMALKVVGNFFSIAYFIMLGAHTAVLAIVIATLGSFMQGVFPDRMLAKTVFLRTGIAVSLAVAGMFTMAHDVSQLWPLVAVVIARISEVQSCTQRIRFGFLFAQMCWIAYAVEQNMLLLYVTENIATALNAFSIWRFEQQRKKAVAVQAVTA